MHRVAASFAAALLASPALATGLEIVVAGEANGTIKIDLLEEVAPNHVARITELAEAGAYDGVIFHRVINDFMAQTGDVQYGRIDGDFSQAGFGQSQGDDLRAEFSDIAYERGIVGMGRKGHSIDTANSQFFIMFTAKPHLNGQYTVVGRVTEGMEVVDAIKRGDERTGNITGMPDVMQSVTVTE